jgi:hypothetical protein
VTISGHSNRTLDLLVSDLARCKASVALTGRLSSVGAVVLSQRRILLDPRWTTVYDLFFCAELLRKRKQLRPWEGEEQIPDAVVAEVLRDTQRDVERRFPGLRSFPGGLRGATPDTLVLSWRGVKATKLEANQIGEDGRGMIASGHGLEGTEEDFETLLEAISRGRIPLQRLDGLPELPFAVCPLDIGFASLAPDDWEVIERSLEGVEVQARDLARCMSDKAEGEVSHAQLHERFLEGDLADPALLHDAALASMRGVEVPIYRSDRQERDYLFEPSEHLMALCFDLSSLRRGSLLLPGINDDLIYMIARALEHLEADTLVLAFLDHLVELASGEQIYLHQPLVLKRADQPFDQAFWGRLRSAISLGRDRETDDFCWHPVQFRSLERELRAAAEGQGYRHFEPFLLAPRGTDQAPYDHPGFLRRGAEDIDRRLDDLRGDLEGRWGEFYVVHEELIDNAPPEGSVSEMLDPRWRRR